MLPCQRKKLPRQGAVKVYDDGREVCAPTLAGFTEYRARLDARGWDYWKQFDHEFIAASSYYEEAGITIYHGDCREMVHSLDYDVVLSDPPYGINHPTNYATRGRGQLANTHDYTPVHGDDSAFDPSFLIDSRNAILWGANYYADKLPITWGWLVWDKRVQQGVGVNDQADCELAWTNCVKGARVFRHMWNGFWKDSERSESYHPTQKPVALMRWTLNLKWVVDGTVCDPYMGSGSVLIAAKELGRKAIGIEIEEAYCEIAANRLRQSVLNFEGVA